MASKILLLLSTLSTAAFGQPAQSSAQVSTQQFYGRNFIPNFSAFKNTTGWTGSSVTVARDTDAADAFEGIASFALTSATNPATFCTADITVPKPYADGVNGEASVYFKGDASKWQLEVRSSGGSSVLNDVDLTNVAGWTRASLNYPIGTSYRICVSSNTASPANINVAGVYWGPATNISSASSIMAIPSYTPTTNGLGTISSVSITAQRVGAWLFLNGQFAAGVTSAAEGRIGLPPGLTASSEYTNATYVGDLIQNRASATTRKRLVLKAAANDSYLTIASDDYTAALSPVATNLDGNAITSSEAVRFHAAVKINGWQAETAVRPDQSGLTPWVTDTCTLTNFGNATVACKTRRIGDSMQISARVLIGSTLPTSTLQFNIPSTVTIDTTKLPNATQVSGFALADDVGVGGHMGGIYTASASALSFYGGDGDNVWTASVPFTFAQNDIIYVEIMLPIVGWTQTMPAPILVGGLTQPSSGAEQLTRATITFNSGSCTVNSAPGSWLTYSSSGADGDCTFTMSGFTSAPDCFVTPRFDGAPSRYMASAWLHSAPTQTSLRVKGSLIDENAAFASSVAPLTTYTANIHCQGPR